MADSQDPTATVKNTSATNPSLSDSVSNQKMADSRIVGDTTQDISRRLSNLAGIATDPVGFVGKEISGWASKRLKGLFSIPSGAQPPKPKPAVVNIVNAQGNGLRADTRVRIKVPTEYLESSTTQGWQGELAKLGGILFPYTPSISYEHKADYTSSNPLHSNFSLYFYQRSSVSPISITGKFTVQNEADAAIYLSTVHLLRSLTKMRFGDDYDKGSPPPVCRLFAYGDYMLDNVPVVITSFKNDLPDSVDFFTLGKIKPDPVFGVATVPVVSTISITCNPVYSRDEKQKTSVTGWLGNSNVRRSGIL